MRTKEQAQADAEKLLARMTTTGWKIRILENLEWHFSLYNAEGMITLSPCHKGKKYCCFLSDAVIPFTGSFEWRDSNSYADPNEAVRQTLDYARRCLLRRAGFLVDLQRQLSSSGLLDGKRGLSSYTRGLLKLLN